MDLGVGGVSYVELLILYELWAGESLSLGKAHLRYLRPGRPISVSAVPFGPGIDIWRSCRFIGAMMRSLCLLPGGLERFVTFSIGANHCRLSHVGWEKCGHGLTSRPRESASEPFLNELLGKTPPHLLGLVVQSRPRVWKRLHHAVTICVSLPDRKRRRRDQDDVGNVPAQIRTGVG